MAWVNNNKRNARFNPNRRDDRLWGSQVTSVREHRVKREAEPEVELVSTEPGHVLSMGLDTRLDWLQMALMQSGLGKLKADSLLMVLTDAAFGVGDGPPSARKALKAMVLANLHLFGGRQKRAVQEAVASWPEGPGGGDGPPAGEKRAGDRGRDARRATDGGNAQERRGRAASREKEGSRRSPASSPSSSAKPPRGSSSSRPRGRKPERRKSSGSERRSDVRRSRSRARSRSRSRSRQRLRQPSSSGSSPSRRGKRHKR